MTVVCKNPLCNAIESLEYRYFYELFGYGYGYRVLNNTRCASARYTLCFVNNFRHSRTKKILNTNSETRILGYFVEIPHNKIAQQMAEIFELKEKSSILTCILRVFSVHFENFGRLYLLNY